MGTVAGTKVDSVAPPSEGQLARAIDRWIYVFMAAWFIVIALAGFLPDSATKIGLVDAGKRAPFPIILHLHAVLMGSFLLLLLAQTTLVATGRRAFHRQLGLAGAVLAPAVLVVGFILVPTMYHLISDNVASAPPAAQGGMRQTLRALDNTLLLQVRGGVLFAIFVGAALAVRKSNSGLHKRLMFIGVASVLGAAFNRMPWLPNTMPGSPLSVDLYIVLAVMPMFVWDVIRTRKIHAAYLIWAAIGLPAAIAVNALWNADGWHSTAQHLLGAG
ncbi:MAG TPA: hypothetical protein VG942_00955 [Hyphomonadaceae bacterium]|nr:hypothetical protein [Hyphomonadaceae bacterium]